MVLLLFFSALSGCTKAEPDHRDLWSKAQDACISAALGRGDVYGANGCIHLIQGLRAQGVARSQSQPQTPDTGHHPAYPPLAAPAEQRPSQANVRDDPPPDLFEPGSEGITVTLASISGATVLTISGPIAVGDHLKLAAALHRAAGMSNSEGGVVFLDSPGGSVSEAALIAVTFQNSDIPVAVRRGGRCASACFLIVASSKNKWASPYARIGVHSAADGQSGVETMKAKAVTTELARACARVGVPSSIIGRMVTTPPDQMAWLSPAEISLMGVHLIPTPFDD